MMRTVSKIAACFLCALILFALLSVCCKVEAASPIYKNPETGFTAVIADEADLLSDAEEKQLIMEMTELTSYAYIAVYTVSTRTSLKDYERARQKRAELFGSDDAALLMVDMYLRRVIIQRYGVMETYFTNSTANNITNNVAPYLTNSRYYSGISTGIDQMTKTVKGEHVPSPMRYAGNVCVALSLAALIVYIAFKLTSTTYHKPTMEGYLLERSVNAPIKFGNLTVNKTRTESKYSPASSGSDGGSSCSSCSSCGSSCGGSSF